MAAGNTTKPDPLALCPKCKSKHKPGQRCYKSKSESTKPLPLVHGHLTLANVKTKEQLKELQQSWPKYGNCPACSKPHTFERQFPCGKATLSSARFTHCPIFRAMTPKQRGEMLEKEKGCWRCLDWIHDGKDGKWRQKCGVLVGSNRCQVDHHRLIHDSGVA